jgi:hypothetical protein
MPSPKDCKRENGLSKRKVGLRPTFEVDFRLCVRLWALRKSSRDYSDFVAASKGFIPLFGGYFAASLRLNKR